METFRDLYQTPADCLGSFVQQMLVPQKAWRDQVQDAWQRISSFFKEHCFGDHLFLDQEVQVLKVVKGGSSGKGTTVNHSSDVDMVVFLSCFSSFWDQALYREMVIDFVKKRLGHYSRSLAYSITVIHHKEGVRAPRSLSIQVQAKKNGDIIKVDVLPAFDALGNISPNLKPEPAIYEALIKSFSHPGEFSPSFAVLQRHFVKSRPVKLKDLLRLVKHWYQQYVKPAHRTAALPSKYALELLTIYAWEEGADESESFGLDVGFEAVMKLLREYEDICIYWTKYYDFQSEDVKVFIKNQLKEDRPVILDPVDPTNNLGRGKRWDLVAKEAAHCLRQPCCKTEDPSQSWHVQPARNIQVTVKQRGKEDWTLWVNPYRPILKMKAEIRKKNDLNGKMRLSFQEPRGERQLLSSRGTLAEHGIFSKVSVRVVDALSGEILVFVKSPNGLSMPVAIHPEDSIWDLKEKIEEAGGPAKEDQILKCPDHKVWNHSSISDLEIKDCDTISLFIKNH